MNTNVQYTGIGLDLSCKVQNNFFPLSFIDETEFSMEYLSTQNHVSWYVFMLILTYRPYWK